MYNVLPVLPIAELVVFAGPVLERARVAFVGTGDASIFDEAEVRSAHFFDPASNRAEHAERFTGSLPVRDGAFDVILCPDLTALPDARAALTEFRRVLGRSGTLVLASPNAETSLGQVAPGALGYYELYDTIALQFEHVRMFGATDFTGRAIAELGNEEPEVSVDGSLAGEGRTPFVYVVVATQREAHVVPGYSLIETESPSGATHTLDSAALSAVFVAPDSSASGGSGEMAALRTENEELRRRLHSEEARTKSESSSLKEELTRATKALERELATERSRADSLRGSIATLEGELGSTRTELALERERSHARTREIAALGADLEAARRVTPDGAELEKLRTALSEKEVTIVSLRGEVAKRDADLAELRAAATSHETTLTATNARLATALLEIEGLRREHEELSQGEGASLEVHAREHARAEEQLVAQGKEIAALRRAMADRARMVEDLLREVPSTKTDDGALRAKLDHLAVDVARRESEVRASAWRIAELEERLRRRESLRPPR